LNHTESHSVVLDPSVVYKSLAPAAIDQHRAALAYVTA
jgi:hypothetical protein